MTISSESRKAGPFDGNGITVDFPFAFKVFSASDVLVVLADADGVEQVVELTSDYTVSLNADQNANPGGTVSMLVAPGAGEKLVVSSAVPILQPSDITNQGGFYPNVVEDSLDRSAIQLQQIAEQVARSVRVPITSGVDPVLLVSQLRADSVAAVNAAENAAASQSAALESKNKAQQWADNPQDVAVEAGKFSALHWAEKTQQLAAPVVENEANINAVAADAADIGTVAENIADVNTVADALANPLSAASAVSYNSAITGLASNVQAAIDAIGKPATQAEMEAGTETALRSMSPIRIKQAIDALASVTFASPAENAAGTVTDKAVDPLGVREAFNASGSAPVYACRAWVNFNGTGTVAIRGSGNVSSIGGDGTGQYTVNLATAMPDADYAVIPGGTRISDAATDNFGMQFHSLTTTSFKINTFAPGVSYVDSFRVMAAVFR